MISGCVCERSVGVYGLCGVRWVCVYGLWCALGGCVWAVVCGRQAMQGLITAHGRFAFKQGLLEPEVKEEAVLMVSEVMRL